MSKKSKHNNNIPQTDQYGQFESMDAMNVASDTECTGMIPTPPGGCDDCNSYREIYDIPAEPSDRTKTNSNKKSRKNNQ